MRAKSVFGGLGAAFHDCVGALDAHAAAPLVRLGPPLLGGLGLALLVYVPVHELLHAAGCVLLGGRVERIEISSLFGGSLLARLLPTVSSATSYAGRLAQFEVRGSDAIFLATDLFPYLLTVLVGVPLLRALRYSANPWLLGPAFVLALAPWMSLTGDYYEIGSILVTRVAAAMGTDFSALRSDDMVSLLAALWTDPRSIGLPPLAAGPAAIAVVGASFAVGFILASLTYGLGALVSAGLLRARSASRPGHTAGSRPA